MEKSALMRLKNYDFYYKLRTLPFVQAIYLYGSRAKGLDHDRSDIDLAIVCPKASPEDWLGILTIIDHADTLIKIDCLRLDTLSDERLKREIMATKVVLFERVDNAYLWYETFLDLGEALDKLADILAQDLSNFPYAREAAIQVFEYSFEFFWKLLKKICRDEGVETNAPRTTLQQAYTLKLIEEEALWLTMMEDRNLTSHTYKQPIARDIYERLKRYVPVMQLTYERLKQRYKL